MEEKSEFIKWLLWQFNTRGGGSQRDLANMCGVSQPTIYRLLSEKRPPTMTEIVTFAYAFGEEDHLPDLFDMAGYSDKGERYLNRRNLSNIQNEKEDLFFKNDDGPKSWWCRYERRKDM